MVFGTINPWILHGGKILAHGQIAQDGHRNPPASAERLLRA
jgi:hypothetical protein